MLPPYVVLTPRTGTARAAGPKVAVVGLTEALRYKVMDGPDNGKIHFLDPGKVADGPLARARQEGDLLVLLGNFGDGTARLIAGKHPEIDVIIGCDERLLDPLQEEFNGVPIFITGTQGKRLVRLDLHRRKGPRRWQIAPEIVELDKTIADDPDGVRLVERMKEDTRERARRAADYSRMDSHYPAYLGSEACASCHAAAMAAWRQSGHSRAWSAVQQSDNTRTPLCLDCHTTGYLRPNGLSLQNLPPKLTGVGCEACHGPGSLHAGDPKNVHLSRGDEQECRACHTPGQTPGFSYAGQWARIRH